MKLQTSIQARRDGSVRVKGASGRDYVFTAETHGGPLTCEIEDLQDLAQLLRIPGCFFPVNDADLEAVVGLLKDSDSDDDEDPDTDPDDDPENDPVDMNAPPVEGVGASDEPPIEGAGAPPALAPAPAPAARKPRTAR